MSSSERPIIKIPLSYKEKVIVIISTLFIVSVLLYLKYVWAGIPQTIPTHFGFSGAPDRYGDKSSLFTEIIIVTIVHIGLCLLSKIPQYYNYPMSVTKKNAEFLYKQGRQLILLIDIEISFWLSILSWQNIQSAMGKIYGINAGIMLLFVAVLILTIIYETVKMFKVKGNVE